MTADPFGSPEVVDPDYWPRSLASANAPVLAVDGAGNAMWASFARNDDSDDQMAIYERCGTAWTRTLLGTASDTNRMNGLRVAPDGTAMAVWEDQEQGTVVHYSAVRPPGGAWGAPQTIVSDADVSNVQFTLADNGDAIAVFEDPAPQRGIYAVFRPAGGAWGAREPVVAAVNPQHVLRHDVALTPSGEAILLFQQFTPGWVYSRYRDASGAWGGEQKVLREQLPKHDQEPRRRVRRARPRGRRRRLQREPHRRGARQRAEHRRRRRVGREHPDHPRPRAQHAAVPLPWRAGTGPAPRRARRPVVTHRAFAEQSPARRVALERVRMGDAEGLRGHWSRRCHRQPRGRRDQRRRRGAVRRRGRQCRGRAARRHLRVDRALDLGSVARPDA